MANIVGDLDRAIECSINPELDQQVRDAALKFLNDVRVMPDAWKLALMKLFNSKNDNPLFFCFQVLEELFKADRYQRYVSVFAVYASNSLASSSQTFATFQIGYK